MVPLALLLALLAPAHAADDVDAPRLQDGHMQSFARKPLAGRPILDVRLAASGPAGSGDFEHPYFCVTGLPHRRIVLEGCGNGSGFLHQDSAPELAHFRASAVIVQRVRARTDIGLLAGAGLAELQVGADEAGFKTGASKSDDQVEAAGPELSAGLKARWWVLPGAYLVGDLNVGAAHLPAAPDVLGRGGAVVPFGTIGIGLGL